MIFTKKIFKIGNSFGVIIPKALADYLSWRVGIIVDVRYDSRRKVIIVRDKTGRGISVKKKAKEVKINI